MQIRRIALRTADGLNPTPMAISWVRDGIFMSCMDNEIAVFSQWRGGNNNKGSKGGKAIEAGEVGKGMMMDGREVSAGDIVDHRSLQETDILNLAQVRSGHLFQRFWLEIFGHYFCEGAYIWIIIAIVSMEGCFSSLSFIKC